jgi:hypothetical protein
MCQHNRRQHRQPPGLCAQTEPEELCAWYSCRRGSVYLHGFVLCQAPVCLSQPNSRTWVLSKSFSVNKKSSETCFPKYLRDFLYSLSCQLRLPMMVLLVSIDHFFPLISKILMRPSKSKTVFYTKSMIVIFCVVMTELFLEQIFMGSFNNWYTLYQVIDWSYLSWITLYPFPPMIFLLFIKNPLVYVQKLTR